MSEIRASAEREVEAPPEAVFAFLSDYQQARETILTDNYRDYRVEAGGVGEGTVVSYRFAAGRRERDYRLSVEVPEEGRVLRERDEGSSFRTTWSVTDADAGGARVIVTSTWQGAQGVAGLFERTFAPRGLARIYGQVLERLARALER